MKLRSGVAEFAFRNGYNAYLNNLECNIQFIAILVRELNYDSKLI